MASAATSTSDVASKGAVIGRYIMLGLVGRGGMGEVYAAFDPELDRKVAVKLLRGLASGAANADGRLRLLREAQAIAKLTHPNVVVVYDVGTFKDSVFIAMEFVDGNTIGYWLQAAARPWREVLEVFGAAGRGLAAAHAAGMVHRDFKPDNVMLMKDGQVRVMDFGLARQQLEEDAPAAAPAPSRMQHLIELGEEPVEGSVDLDATARIGPGAPAAPAASSGSYLKQKLTQTGALLGTPAYMAPEQFAGEKTDARTDQFSFCVALYEALYGHRPFEGDTVVALMANVVSGTIRDEPAGPPVPARLRKVLLRGLEADPDKRHASMTDLLAELQKDPASRRRRWFAGALALTTLGLAAVLGARQLSGGQRALCAGGANRLDGIWELGASSPRKAQIERVFAAKGKGDGRRLIAGVAGLLDAYVGRWVAMYRDTCEATHVRGEQSAEVLDLRMTCLGQRLASVKALTDIFASADQNVVGNAVSAAGALPSLERCADVAMLRSVVQPPSDQATRARVEAARADIARVRALGDSGQCAEAVAAGRAAVAETTKIGYLPVEAEANHAVGRLGQSCVDGATAADALEESIWQAEASHHDEVAVEASAYAAALVADRLHDARTARRWARHADALLQRLPGHPLLEANTHVAWGIILQAEGKDTEALAEQQRALELKERSLGPLHPESALSAMNVGVALHTLGRDAEAESDAKRAVETLETLYGADGVEVAVALLDWAEPLTSLGRLHEARAALERAIAIWTHEHASPFFIAYGRFDLARVALGEARVAEARDLLQGATETIFDQDHAMGAEARFLLAETLWATPRDRPRALALARDARKALVAASAPKAKLEAVDAWLGSREAPPPAALATASTP